MRGEALALAGAVVAGVLALSWPVLASPAGVVIGGGGGDFGGVAWSLWRAIQAFPPPVSHEGVFYPRGATLLLADLPEALAVGLVTAIGGAIPAFNLLQLAHVGLAAGLAHALLRAEGRGAAGAAAGGLAFALSPTLLTGIRNGNPDASAWYLLPLAGLLARRIGDGWGWAAGAGAAAGLACWCSPYAGVMAGIVAAVFVRGGVGRIAAAGGIAAGIGGAYFAAMTASLRAADTLVSKPLGPPHGAAHLSGFFLPVLEQQPDGWSLHGWYLGAAVIALAAVGHRGWRWWALIGAGLVLALGPTLRWGAEPLTIGGYKLALPGAMLSEVPGIGALRISYRFGALAALGAGGLAAAGVDRLGKAGWAAVVVVAAELAWLGAPLVRAGEAPSLEECALLAEVEPGPVLTLPGGRDERALLAQTCHGRAVAEGLNRPYPQPVQRALASDDPAKALAKLGFVAVVVRGQEAEDPLERRAMARLGAGEGTRVIALPGR